MRMPCASACSRVLTCPAEPPRRPADPAPAPSGADPGRGTPARARRGRSGVRDPRDCRPRGRDRPCRRRLSGDAVAVERPDRARRRAAALDRRRQPRDGSAAKSVRASAARDGPGHGSSLVRRGPADRRPRRWPRGGRGCRLRRAPPPSRQLPLRRRPPPPPGPPRPAPTTGARARGRAGERLPGSAGDPPLRSEPQARARLRRRSAPRAYPRRGVALRTTARVPTGRRSAVDLLDGDGAARPADQCRVRDRAAAARAHPARRRTDDVEHARQADEARPRCEHRADAELRRYREGR